MSEKRVELDELKRLANQSGLLIEIINEDPNVRLKSSGGRYWGLCPFHDEKTPSFSVSSVNGTQLYRCHGSCGCGGDIFTFLKERDGLEFIDAANAVAERLGVDYIFTGKGNRVINREFTRKSHDLLEHVCAAYQVELMEKPDVIKYLNGRGITKEMIGRFKIGFAPAEGMLESSFRSSLDDLETLGLVNYYERGLGIWQDLLRNRIIFPITDVRGRPISFAGRINPVNETETLPDGRKIPKYVNGATSPLFSKSRTPFGLFQAAQRLREGTIKDLHIVEGPPDAIIFDAYGLPTLALQGAANFDEQMGFTMGSLRHAREYSFLDGDPAGQKASVKFAGKSLGKLRNPFFAELPNGYDPDTFIIERGVAGVEELKKNARQGLDFLVTGIIQIEGAKIDTPEGKSRIIEIAQPYFMAVDEMEREMYAEAFAQRIGIRTAHAMTALFGKNEIMPEETRVLASLMKTGSSVRASYRKQFPPEIMPSPEGRALAHAIYGMNDYEVLLDGMDLFAETPAEMAEGIIRRTAVTGEFVRPARLAELIGQVRGYSGNLLNGELETARTALYTARLDEMRGLSTSLGKKANDFLLRMITEGEENE